MGQGGNITLVNGTAYDWQQTYTHQYQMNAWNFPATIPAGTSASVYVEWDQGVFTTQSDDAGEVTYTLAGTAFNFQIQANASAGFMLRVQLLGLTALNYPQGSTLPLGWDWNNNPSGGHVTFVLAGEPNYFQVSGQQSGPWMQNALPSLGGQPLRHLCMPGSHDAGMSVLNSGTAFAQVCNTQTQTTGILGQLQYGARYFDIRPVISGGHYYTGHYGQVSQLNSWQGGNGQSIASIISDVNTYTAANAELIILNLSHDLNTDIGNSSYAPFTQDEWNALFTQLQGINHLYVSSATDLSVLPLNDFIGSKQAAVVVVVEASGNGINLGSYAGKGFYAYAAFNAYNVYANTNDVNQLATDQLAKLKQQRPSPDSDPFLLSWTLTQDSTQAATCALGTAYSILALASIANPQVYLQLLGACTAQSYPNIIYTDGAQDASPAALAMAVNRQAVAGGKTA
jgi:hypothetical protein